ncbi:hypothetical protein H6P81_013090 [Aristolochia fimbriata]|uniref:Rhodanese domain-containing protein n=1 Tax=Aristolochia fimbriata TaxID=158543 RepID=A0AAV7EDP4_ARIFI|nr:hypothetical protein H6P81_013090 [Aristolochia fimbriata]
MLPVCSTAPACSSNCQISFHTGSKVFFAFRKSAEDRYFLEDKFSFATPGESRASEISFKTNAAKSLYTQVFERSDQSNSMDFANIPPYQNELNDFVYGLSNECLYGDSVERNYSLKAVNGSYPTGQKLCFVENSSLPVQGEYSLGQELGTVTVNGFDSQSNLPEPSGDTPVLPDLLSQSTSSLSESPIPEFSFTSDASSDILYERPILGSDTMEPANDAFSKLTENINGFFSGLGESVDSSIDNANSTIQDTYDAISLSLLDKAKVVRESFESSIGGLLSSTDKTGELVNDKLGGLTSKMKETTFEAGNLAVNVLRSGIVAVEGSLLKASATISSSYESAKPLLPAEVRDVLNSSEQKVIAVLKPVGAALQQVFVLTQGIEKYFGFDPNDPVVPFVLFVGSSAILVISYRVLKYGGYSGDLSPSSAFEMLSKNDDVVLIDIRSEDLRERDGIPDIRRGARFRYSSVTFPEVDASLKKIMKNGTEVENALLAAVIRNLKIVQDRSKVIVMDANGSCSKGVARSLRKLGVKNPFLVQGGFRSWAKDGLRVKENRPETALTILNEEAEAILEEFKPSPGKLLGYGMGVITATYALIEWERTLQLIGLIGLGQTLFRRVASYKTAEDLKKDLRLLASPVGLGAQAFSWVIGKVEPNKLGLPTSPSSTAVQSRVLQAAAKHESQPSDADESQEPSAGSSTPTSENLDLSEA